MNPLLPLAALGVAGGLYVYSKKTPAGKLADAKKKQDASNYTVASWSTSMSVADVQHALNQLGASPQLQVDGQAGPKTTAAIKSFQAQAGISVDGVIGPQTETALHHALGGANTQVMGWFLLCCDEEEEECTVGASMIEAIDRSRPGRGIRQAIEGGHMVGAGGWGSSTWTAPSVSDITNDPQQRMQIGLLEMRRAQAQAAFPDTKAAGYDYSFLPDQGASELAEAQAAYYGLEAERQANLNAVSGEYEDECEEEFYTGAEDWSAPDVQEIYNDPYQTAQLEYEYEHMYGQPGLEWGYAQPYPQQGVYGPPYLPYPTSSQGYYTQPGMTSAMPTLGAIPAPNPVNAVVPGQGYQFQSQQGRNF